MNKKILILVLLLMVLVSLNNNLIANSDKNLNKIKTVKFELGQYDGIWYNVNFFGQGNNVKFVYGGKINDKSFYLNKAFHFGNFSGFVSLKTSKNSKITLKEKFKMKIIEIKELKQNYVKFKYKIIKSNND